MVLIAEALTPDFGKRFWEFVKEGGYENRLRSNGTPQYFRFDKPKKSDFPYMIELFSKSENILDSEGHDCIPLHLDDDISSLSAILLNSSYYQMLIDGRTIIDDVVILSTHHLIPFKARAWLDLLERKSQGYHVDERDIKKHKNDVIRLTSILVSQERCLLSEEVRKDMELFVEKLEKEPINPKILKIPGVSFEDIIKVLQKVYL